MAASCRRERQNGGLKGSEKRQKTCQKQCRKTHGILMHAGSEHLTKNEPQYCQMQKVDENDAKNSSEKWRPNVLKNGAQREAKTTQDPDKLPTKSRHGARDPPRREKEAKIDPK